MIWKEVKFQKLDFLGLIALYLTINICRNLTVLNLVDAVASDFLQIGTTSKKQDETLKEVRQLLSKITNYNWLMGFVK